MMEDEKIIDLYFQRDERALVETSGKYGNYCRSIARGILNDEETAKECFNDTLYRSWNAIPPTRPECLQTFLGKITRNLSLDRLRRDRSVKRGGGEAVVAIDELEECLADHIEGKPEQVVEDIVIREVIDKFLNGLSTQNRRIFIRRYWYFSSIRDIAELYDLSESNVMTNLSRSRAKLKEALEKAGVVL